MTSFQLQASWAGQSFQTTTSSTPSTDLCVPNATSALMESAKTPPTRISTLSLRVESFQISTSSSRRTWSVLYLTITRKLWVWSSDRALTSNPTPNKKLGP